MLASMSLVRTGLDRLAANEGPALEGRRISLLCHPASVDAQLRHARQIVEGQGANIVSLLGPEHGLDAAAQDMEVVSEGTRKLLGVPVHSLYGDTVDSLKPQAHMFEGAELLIVDLQDVGARYYTYVWTALMAAEAALDAGLEVLLLDRPNPLGGSDDWVEGGAVEPGFRSFVGWRDVAVRHGMTLAEIVMMSLEESGHKGLERLMILGCEGWRRGMLFGETGLPWILPSPNMPTMDTALVYPGQCLLEGTQMSEGRGTTRPFEISGAPWLSGEAWAAALDTADMPGLRVRPMAFKPTFQKCAGRGCGGVQLHVVEAEAVRSLRSSWAMLRAAYDLGGSEFAWRTDRYEFVDDRPAIDLLAGGPWLREMVESGSSVAEMMKSQKEARDAFVVRRRPFLRYA
jgi:uncharacterized protein YbbC (DUF1343 family)